jgi:hypothetical protein
MHSCVALLGNAPSENQRFRTTRYSCVTTGLPDVVWCPWPAWRSAWPVRARGPAAIGAAPAAHAGISSTTCTGSSVITYQPGLTNTPAPSVAPRPTPSPTAYPPTPRSPAGCSPSPSPSPEPPAWPSPAWPRTLHMTSPGTTARQQHQPVVHRHRRRRNRAGHRGGHRDQRRVHRSGGHYHLALHRPGPFAMPDTRGYHRTDRSHDRRNHAMTRLTASG